VREPRRPQCEVGEVLGLLRRLDHPDRNAPIAVALVVALDVRLAHLLVGVRFRGGVLDGVAPVVRAVEVVADRLVDRRALGGAERVVAGAVLLLRVVLAHVLGLQIERFGGVVLAVVRAVTEYRPVVHQPVLLERRLPVLHRLPGGDRLAVGTDDLLGNRRRLLVREPRPGAHYDQIQQERRDDDLRDRLACEFHRVVVPSTRTISLAATCSDGVPSN